jgi:hypothetical protein
MFFCKQLSFAQKTKHESKYYYIGEVLDNRNTNTESIGNIYIENSNFQKPFLIADGLKNWVKKKIETTINEASNINPYFVNLSINQLNFKENNKNEKFVSGVLKFEGNFYLENSTDSISIFPFKYTVKYRRKIGEEAVLFNQINEKLADVTNRLESWFTINYGNNQKLARHVKVITSDFNPKEKDSDTLYHCQRKITLDDFTSKTGSAGPYAASIFTNMAYQSFVEMKNDTIFLDFKVKVYQVKNMSWVIENAKNKITIDHEQTHFDITQIVAEKFKERLREEALPTQDFDSRIQYLYLEYFRMINRQQNKYDNETEHGLNKAEQARWEQKVKDELATFNTK